MYKSYRARITGNRIEWFDETPPEVLAGKPVKVLVTVLDTMAAKFCIRRVNRL